MKRKTTKTPVKTDFTRYLTSEEGKIVKGDVVKMAAVWELLPWLLLRRLPLMFRTEAILQAGRMRAFFTTTGHPAGLTILPALRIKAIPATAAMAATDSGNFW